MIGPFSLLSLVDFSYPNSFIFLFCTQKKSNLIEYALCEMNICSGKKTNTMLCVHNHILAMTICKIIITVP